MKNCALSFASVILSFATLALADTPDITGKYRNDEAKLFIVSGGESISVDFPLFKNEGGEIRVSTTGSIHQLRGNFFNFKTTGKFKGSDGGNVRVNMDAWGEYQEDQGRLVLSRCTREFQFIDRGKVENTDCSGYWFSY